jgi:predicted permease
VGTLRQDLRYAVRLLRRQPGFAAVAILTLALGIGATTAVFTVVNGVLLRPLPYPDADRIVELQSVGRSGRGGAISPADFVDYQRLTKTMASVAALTEADVALTGAGEPERITGQVVTPEFFDVMGVHPSVGRAFAGTSAKDDRYAVLGYGLWQRAFGSDPSIVGRTIALDGEPYLVTGVMPAGFAYPDRSEIWLPLAFTPHQIEDSQRGARWIQAIGRLHPGVTITGADADVSRIAAQLAAAYPDKDGKYGARATALLDTMVDGVRPALLVLQAAVVLVLLIACANVANLFLVRAAGRRAEVAVRASLGATRGRLLRQFLTESVLLAVLGGAAGLLLGVWSVHGLLALDPSALPRVRDVAVTPRVFAFTGLVALLAALVFGSVPALQLARAGGDASLRGGARQVGGGQRRLRASLVVAEMALALLLAVSAGLLMRSFYNLQHVRKGYDPDHVLTFSLFLPTGSYGTPERITAFYHQLLPALEGVPGVESSGMIFGLPLGEFNGHSTFSIEGRHPVDEDEQNAYVRVIGGDYLAAMRIPLRAGRRFGATDTASGPLVAMLNETAARRYFPDGRAIGQRIRVHATFSDGQYGFREIVGIVGDVRHRGLALATDPEIYIPYDQQPIDFGAVVARTRTDPMAAAAAVRDRIHAIDPALPVAGMMPMTAVVADSIASDRFIAVLLALFGALALGLAAIGIYGVMSYAVSQRTREIGLRMALGAGRGDVLRMVAREALRLSAIGIAIGLVTAAAATRALGQLLYGVSSGDPVTFAAVAAVVVVTALAASYFPARRASRVDPMAALRTE